MGEILSDFDVETMRVFERGSGDWSAERRASALRLQGFGLLYPNLDFTAAGRIVLSLTADRDALKAERDAMQRGLNSTVMSDMLAAAQGVLGWYAANNFDLYECNELRKVVDRIVEGGNVTRESFRR